MPSSVVMVGDDFVANVCEKTLYISWIDCAVFLGGNTVVHRNGRGWLLCFLELNRITGDSLDRNDILYFDDCVCVYLGVVCC
jgi:hypothetical protein